MKKCLITLFALSVLTGWKCEPKTPSNHQGIPRQVTVRTVPGYGVTEILNDPKAVGAPFDVVLTFIYECGFAGIYRGPDGQCYSGDGAYIDPRSCLDNGGKYDGQGVDREGLCHEDWRPLIRR